MQDQLLWWQNNSVLKLNNSTKRSVGRQSLRAMDYTKFNCTQADMTLLNLNWESINHENSKAHLHTSNVSNKKSVQNSSKSNKTRSKLKKSSIKVKKESKQENNDMQVCNDALSRAKSSQDLMNPNFGNRSSSQTDNITVDVIGDHTNQKSGRKCQKASSKIKINHK